MSAEAEQSQRQVRELADEQRSSAERCQRLESELSKTERKADEMKITNQSKDSRVGTASNGNSVAIQQALASFGAAAGEQRRQLFERNQELARQRVGLCKGRRGRWGSTQSHCGQWERIPTTCCRANLAPRSGEWRSRSKSCSFEVSEKERCNQLQELLKDRQESKVADLTQLSDLITQAQEHARCLAQVQAERGTANEENEPLKTLKQKYDLKISKLYQHLCDRDAYERKLKVLLKMKWMYFINTTRSWSNIASGDAALFQILPG